MTDTDQLERTRQASRLATKEAWSAAALAQVLQTQTGINIARDKAVAAAARCAQYVEQFPDDSALRCDLANANNAAKSAQRAAKRGPVRHEDWTPSCSQWRHGGWYVDNLRLPSGAVGCVSRNYDDKKWRIVCDPRNGSYPGGPNDHTYPNRTAAARAERELVAAGFRY